MSENNLGATEIQKAYRAWQKKKRAKAAFDRKLAAMKKREEDIERENRFLLCRFHAAVQNVGGCGIGVCVSHTRLHFGKEVEITRGDCNGANVFHVDSDKGKDLIVVQRQPVKALRQLEAFGFIKPEDKFVLYAMTEECLIRTKKGWKVIK